MICQHQTNGFVGSTAEDGRRWTYFRFATQRQSRGDTIDTNERDVVNPVIYIRQLCLESSLNLFYIIGMTHSCQMAIKHLKGTKNSALKAQIRRFVPVCGFKTKEQLNCRIPGKVQEGCGGQAASTLAWIQWKFIKQSV
jgi:hypothetical protein